MSDPKYNKYAGTVRFDDDNIVDIDLQPDTENITVKLNGVEVTGGSGLPDVDSSDNGDVLTVVSGEWTNAAPASQLPAVSGSDNGDVLTVVNGSWANAAPASQLPAVSGSDNGDVLTVVNGSWAKAEKTVVLYSSFDADAYTPSDAPSLSGSLRWKDASIDGDPTLPLYFDSELQNELTLSDFQALPASVIINFGGAEFIPCSKQYVERLNDPIEADDVIYASYGIVLYDNGTILFRYCGFMIKAFQGVG